MRPPEAQKIGFDVPKQLNSTTEFADEATAVSEASGSESFNQDEENNVIYQTMVVTALAVGTPLAYGATPAALSDSARTTLSGYCEVVQTPDQTPDNPNAGKGQRSHYISFTDVMYSYYSNRGIAVSDPIKEFKIENVVFLELPKHGVLKDGVYVPNPGHRGLDQFTASIDVNGKTYKIVMKLVTVGHLADGPYIEKGAAPEYRLANQCDASKVRRIGGSYLRDALPDEWLASAQLSSLLADATTKVVDFLDLPGTAVGTTTSEGANASITLDTTASGHGWYVDATPLDNTDDYLTTSNPNIWQAKAGTDAAGKMGKRGQARIKNKTIPNSWGWRDWMTRLDAR